MNAITARRSANFGHRVRNSLLALSFVATGAALTMLVAHPVPPTAATATLEFAAAAAAVEADPLLAADEPVLAAEAATRPPAKPKHVRRSRQSMAMPFFSFARS